MNRKKKLKNTLLIGVVATTVISFSCCNDNAKYGEDAQPSLAEKMEGKWTVEGSYEKKSDQWVSISAPDDKGWYDFRTDGTVSAYQYVSGHESTAEMKWSVDETTGAFTLTLNDADNFFGEAVFEGEDTLTFLYTTTMDFSTGELLQGEFKDVLLREQE